MDTHRSDGPNPKPPSEPNINKRSTERPVRPPSEPPVRKITSEPVERPPSEPGHKETEQRDIPPGALDRETAEGLLKKAAASGQERVTPDSGVD
jgi:hypothetical protein